jgi:hypothetical protein
MVPHRIPSGPRIESGTNSEVRVAGVPWPEMVVYGTCREKSAEIAN